MCACVRARGGACAPVSAFWLTPSYAPPGVLTPRPFCQQQPAHQDVRGGIANCRRRHPTLAAAPAVAAAAGVPAAAAAAPLPPLAAAAPPPPPPPSPPPRRCRCRCR